MSKFTLVIGIAMVTAPFAQASTYSCNFELQNSVEVKRIQTDTDDVLAAQKQVLKEYGLEGKSIPLNVGGLTNDKGQLVEETVRYDNTITWTVTTPVKFQFQINGQDQIVATSSQVKPSNSGSGFFVTSPDAKADIWFNLDDKRLVSQLSFAHPKNDSYFITHRSAGRLPEKSLAISYEFGHCMDTEMNGKKVTPSCPENYKVEIECKRSPLSP